MDSLSRDILSFFSFERREDKRETKDYQVKNKDIAVIFQRTWSGDQMAAFATVKMKDHDPELAKEITHLLMAPVKIVGNKTVPIVGEFHFLSETT